MGLTCSQFVPRSRTYNLPQFLMPKTINLQLLDLDQKVAMLGPRKQIALRLILMLNIKLPDKKEFNLLLLSEVPKPNFNCNCHNMGDTNTN